MIAILVYEGVSAFEALGAMAAFRAAGLDVDLVAQDALVLAHEGARLVPARLGYASLETAEAVLVPGGDVTGPLRDAALAAALRARRGRWVLASGAGVRVLSHAGLAEGRRVAALPGEDAPAGATAAHARCVSDGRILTSFPGDAVVDLALHYVGHELGDDAAKRAAAALGREHRPFAMGATLN